MVGWIDGWMDCFHITSCGCCTLYSTVKAFYMHDSLCPKKSIFFAVDGVMTTVVQGTTFLQYNGNYRATGGIMYNSSHRADHRHRLWREVLYILYTHCTYSR